MRRRRGVRCVAGRVNFRGARHVAVRRGRCMIRRVTRRVIRRSVRLVADRGGRGLRRMVLDTVPGSSRIRGGLPGFSRPGALVTGCTACGKERQQDRTLQVSPHVVDLLGTGARSLWPGCS
jgi:hypothetical protein